MREDGSGTRQLTDNQWEDGPAEWLPPIHAGKTESKH